MKMKGCIAVILRKLEYTIMEAFVGISRNGFIGFASVTIIALSLAVFGAFVLAALGANNFASAQINRFEIVAFSKNINLNEMNTALDAIKKIDGVKTAEIQDRDKEWANFKKQYPNIDVSGVKGVNGNPLPYKIDVTVSDSAQTSAISDKIRDLPQIGKVNDSRELLGRVMALARTVRLISIIGCAVLFVACVFVISNAIKLTLYARRQEIRTMQLVGASNAFIKIPLIIEGIIFGAIGAFFAWIILEIGGIYLSGTVRKITGLFQAYRTGISPEYMFLSLIILGVFIGIWGSLISIRRFLINQ